MKIDVCPLCGGRLHVGWFAAVCEDCLVEQRAPEWERLFAAATELKRVVSVEFAGLLGSIRRLLRRR